MWPSHLKQLLNLFLKYSRKVSVFYHKKNDVIYLVFLCLFSIQSAETPLLQSVLFKGLFTRAFSVGWFNGPLRQCFSLYRAVSQREGDRGEKGSI